MFKSKYVKSLSAAVILGSSLFAVSPATEAAKNFTDINSDPSHAEAVNYFNDVGVYDYKRHNTLNGEEGVTRLEVAKLLYNVLGDSLEKVRTYKDNFVDINPKTTLYYHDIIWAYEVGIFDGNTEGCFNPMQVLKRAQMTKILVNALSLESGSTFVFKDVSENHWAYKYINILAAKGISIGSNMNFMPEKDVTLNQLSTFLWRALGKPKVATETKLYVTYISTPPIL